MDIHIFLISLAFLGVMFTHDTIENNNHTRYTIFNISGSFDTPVWIGGYTNIKTGQWEWIDGNSCSETYYCSWNCSNCSNFTNQTHFMIELPTTELVHLVEALNIIESDMSFCDIKNNHTITLCNCHYTIPECDIEHSGCWVVDYGSIKFDPIIYDGVFDVDYAPTIAVWDGVDFVITKDMI
eukprot:228189_1